MCTRDALSNCSWGHIRLEPMIPKHYTEPKKRQLPSCLPLEGHTQSSFFHCLCFYWDLPGTTPKLTSLTMALDKCTLVATFIDFLKISLRYCFLHTLILSHALSGACLFPSALFFPSYQVPSFSWNHPNSLVSPCILFCKWPGDARFAQISSCLC